jgi:hypothetical protein
VQATSFFQKYNRLHNFFSKIPIWIIQPVCLSQEVCISFSWLLEVKATGDGFHSFAWQWQRGF